MRPLLSQFLTPADFSQNRRFFRVWKLCRLPGLANHPVYFGSATIYFRQPFRPSTQAILIHEQQKSTPEIGAIEDFSAG
jgi:hypothetical protein